MYAPFCSEIREPSTGAKLLETDTARFKDITSRALDDISDRNRVDPEGIIAHSVIYKRSVSSCTVYLMTHV